MSKRAVFPTYHFALVICRNPFLDSPHYGKWLAVKETRGRGWWIPGGGVDAGESFDRAAIREAREEAGIDVQLKGVLKVDHRILIGSECRMRVIFYAEPATPVAAQQLKRPPGDEESVEARWVSLVELEQLVKQDGPLRGPELFQWGQYLEKGGQIFPLEVLGSEGHELDPVAHKAFTIASAAPPAA